MGHNAHIDQQGLSRLPPYRSITGRTSWSREDIYDDLTENWWASKREWKYTNGAYAWVESGLFDLMPATKYPKIEAGEFADYVNFETQMPNSMRFNTGYHDRNRLGFKQDPKRGHSPALKLTKIKLFWTSWIRH